MLKKILDKIFQILELSSQSINYRRFRKKYTLDEGFRFNGKQINMYGEGQIIGGRNSYVGDYSTWQASEGYKIIIGQGCKISHNVRCYTETSISDFDFSKEPIPSKCGDVYIGDFSWIGANVFINPGVKIGENSIIGANSVVSKDVEPYSIVGGVPAKLIRYKRI